MAHPPHFFWIHTLYSQPFFPQPSASALSASQHHGLDGIYELFKTLSDLLRNGCNLRIPRTKQHLHMLSSVKQIRGPLDLQCLLALPDNASCGHQTLQHEFLGPHNFIELRDLLGWECPLPWWSILTLTESWSFWPKPRASWHTLVPCSKQNKNLPFFFTEKDSPWTICCQSFFFYIYVSCCHNIATYGWVV